jgi:hypothetical protein
MSSLLPALPVLILTAVCSVAEGVYVVTGTPRSQAWVELSSRGLGLFLLFWVMIDARRRRCVPCHEFGFLVAVFMPASLVWYVFWTRGWRGAALLASFIGLVFVPSFVTIVIWTLLHS